MLNDWGVKDTPQHAVLMQAAEILRGAIDNDQQHASAEVISWMRSVAEAGMPGIPPKSVTHRVDRTHHTPMENREDEFFYIRTNSFDMSLIKELGEKQVRVRVYKIHEEGFVVTKAYYDAWGNHNHDSLMWASGGPVVGKAQALELATNLVESVEKSLRERGCA